MDYFVWNMDPVMLSLGALKIHWYGALFASAIVVGLFIMKRIYLTDKKDINELDDLFIYVVIGIIAGARLGHCLFYEPGYYLSNPLEILAVWKGGLASHGGGLGVIFALWLYSRKHGNSLIWLLDRLAIPTVLFGFFVRCANFINAEILGLPTQVSWAVVFEKIDLVPRHPVQLYEAGSYLLIFFTLYLAYTYTRVKEYSGALFGSFLIAVFTARFISEFFKEKQASYTVDWSISTGQILSIPFIVIGLWLVFRSVTQPKQLVS